MKYYFEKTEDVLKNLSSAENGLSEQEAADRLSKNGKNKLDDPPKESLFRKFLDQIMDPMILILIGAAVISTITSIYAHESFTDVFIIMFVVILNSILGVLQESKAEKAIDALKEMTGASSKVIRDGVFQIVKSEDLVVGDIIVLEAGDSVPADARVIESNSLKVEEAALTGESVPVDKYSDVINHVNKDNDVTLGDRNNMLYMGSSIVYGRGKAVVTGTGMNTEMGKIATAITMTEKELTPLQVKLGQLSKILTWIVLGVCVVIFAVGLIEAKSFAFDVILESFMVAVSLAVAAIPEGLVAVVSIVLSIGVTKMSKRSAVIRKLTAVETLGCTQIICSDKTGTLTQNKMTVVDEFANDTRLLAYAMALCSDAILDADKNAVGEPTECALVNYAYKTGHDKTELDEKYPRIDEVPFDSFRKRMTTFHEMDGKIYQFTKGAPDEMLKVSTTYLDAEGKISPLTDNVRNHYIAEMNRMSDKALRVLAAAYKTYDEKPDHKSASDVECNMTFIGLYGMIDPIREEVKDAVKKCKEAGIKVVMITGDHKNTAVAIAKELGIIQDETEVLTGLELDNINDEAFDEAVKNFSVYARVQPEHKVKIVKAWKNNGKITAMTGDGVNDAASIKAADIGIGMGITGTDVTKNVADMVLADDNFATIVSAVEEGRKIYDNIKKCIHFLLSSNLAEVLGIFIATLLGFEILGPVHLLWINLVTDCFPALALGMEGAEADIMNVKPRDSKEGIFANGVGFDIFYQGVYVTIVTLAGYFLGHFFEFGTIGTSQSGMGMTVAFIAMSMSEIFHAFNMRSQRKSIFHLKSHNKWLYGAMILSFILTLSVLYLPGVSDMFGFAHITFVQYLITLGVAFTIVPVVELVKLIQRIIKK